MGEAQREHAAPASRSRRQDGHPGTAQGATAPLQQAGTAEVPKGAAGPSGRRHSNRGRPASSVVSAVTQHRTAVGNLTSPNMVHPRHAGTRSAHVIFASCPSVRRTIPSFTTGASVSLRLSLMPRGGRRLPPNRPETTPTDSLLGRAALAVTIPASAAGWTTPSHPFRLILHSLPAAPLWNPIQWPARDHKPDGDLRRLAGGPHGAGHPRSAVLQRRRERCTDVS
jgi:hypothetical protein